jgi:hypothetical protein
MASCAFCKGEDALFHEYGVPICPDCLGIGKPNPDRAAGTCPVLVHDLTDALVKFEAASLQDPSRDLVAAWENMGRAHRRLNDYLEHGIVPEDLKRGDSI